ncbi:carbohydrate ABC transporter permease [Geminicoccus roseus]|uniref:carbohydrate ABC transporter permease n=1 Tax=Geminicoccus roseus TaxID=404900 RepID=UPI000415E47F|nr:carbohydrate ABC transporter permease [Geminicoccus roseus]
MNLLRWLVFAVAALAMNFPVIATLVTSFKSEAEIASNPSWWIQAPTLANYAGVFAMADRFDVLHYLWNSFASALLGAGLSLVLAFPAAFALVRFGAGRRWLMPLVVNLRAIPLIVFAIPLYLVYARVGLLDTKLGLALILCVVNLPLVLILLAAALRDLPVELDEAARVDGASTFTLLWRIVLPLAGPALATTMVLGFVYAWNEFLFALMLTTRDAVTATVGASFFFAASGGGVRWGAAAAVMMLSVLPPVVLGLLLYRRIGQSLAAGAVKG